MRAALFLFLCLALAACDRKPDPALAQRAVVLRYPKGVVDELEGTARKSDVPMSTLMEDAWEARGQEVLDGLRDGELYRRLPQLKGTRGDRRTQALYLGPTVLHEVRVASAETGIDEGTLLGAAWMLDRTP